MKAHKDFIIHIPETHKSKVKTDSGFKYYVDKNFSIKDSANNIFEVVNTPVSYKGEIKPGSIIVVDPIVVHNQVFQKFGEEENQYLIDREKRLYRIDPSLVICYSMGPGTKFKGFENNLVCERVSSPKPEAVPKKIGSIFIPDSAKKDKNTTTVKVLIGNEELSSMGVEEGDDIHYEPLVAIDVKINDLKLIWLRNKNVLGKVIRKSA